MSKSCISHAPWTVIPPLAVPLISSTMLPECQLMTTFVVRVSGNKNQSTLTDSQPTKDRLQCERLTCPRLSIQSGHSNVSPLHAAALGSDGSMCDPSAVAIC